MSMITITLSKPKKFLCYFGHNWVLTKSSEDETIYYWKCSRCSSKQVTKDIPSDSEIDPYFFGVFDELFEEL